MEKVKNTDEKEIQKRKDYMKNYYLKKKMVETYNKKGVIVPHIIYKKMTIYFD
jgi:ribosomal protein S19